MSNNKDLILKNQLQIGSSIDVTSGTIADGTLETYHIQNLVAKNFLELRQGASQSSAVFNFAFKTDGTKLYAMSSGGANDDIYQYSLATPWSIATASYDSALLDVSAQETTPTGIAFKPDGTKVYIVGSNSDTVYQYGLTTAWDISTGSYDSKSFSVSSQDTTPYDVFFKPDGTKFYILGSGNNTVYQYSMSTAWDVSTASYDSVSFSYSAQESSTSFGLQFNDTGTKMFVSGSTNSTVYQYGLTTAWDVSTASYDNVYFDLTSYTAIAPYGIRFGKDGEKFYVIDNNEHIVEFDSVLPPVDTSFDVSNATYDSLDTGTTINANETDSRKLFFKPDGTKVFVLGNSSGDIWEYPLENAWDLNSLGSSTANKDLLTYAANLRGGFFKPDGTKFYSAHLTNDTVGEWVLSTPWDVSTMTHQTPLADYEIELSSDVTSLDDVEFSSDGTRMIVLDIGDNPKIKSFTLSTAWDVTTATYDGDSASFDVSSVTGKNPNGIRFNSDGTVLYVTGNDTYVRVFPLSTGYDLSTVGDMTQYKDLSENTSPRAVDFSSDGQKLFMLGNGGTDRIYQYTCGTRKRTATLDLSTGNYFSKTLEGDTKIVFDTPSTVQTFNLELVGSESVTGGFNKTTSESENLDVNYYNGVRKQVSEQGDSLQGLSVSTDGTKMFVCSNNSQLISEYKLDSPFNITSASYTGVQFDLSSQGSTWLDIYVKPDGTALYGITTTGDTVQQYEMSTGWDLSTMSYSSKSFSVASQDATPQSVTLDTTGKRMYVAGNSNDSIYRYDLGTPWDVSTAVFANSKSISAQTTSPTLIRFSYDGTKMYVSTSSNNTFIYDCIVPFESDSATYSGVIYQLNSANDTDNFNTTWLARDITAVNRSMSLSQDGTKMYILTSSRWVLEYNIGKLETVDWPSSVQWVNGSPPPNPGPEQKDLYTFTTSDGGITYWGQRVETNIG